MKEKNVEKVKKYIEEERKIISELEKTHAILEKSKEEDKQIIKTQIGGLESNLKKIHDKLKENFGKIIFSKNLPIAEVHEEKKQKKKEQTLKSLGGKTYSLRDISPINLEKETIRRIREKEKKEKEKKKKDKSEYSKIASKLFSKKSRILLGQKNFKDMEEQLIKANLNYTPIGYISMIILTTIISIFAAIFLFMFFLFFNVEATLPIVTRALDPINIRFLKAFWILFAIPLGTFLFMYSYPSMERKNAESSIDSELPFATIHMSAISGSMINPLKIFEIILSTKEYPALEKEFTKMINEINLYGYDLVSALQNTAKNTSSKKLSELLNGLSTTIHSGGDLPKFFEKRAETLLFNYRLERQKESKAAETSMDIYISMVIAAPMILMLLMIIMKLSGLGLTMSIGGISLLIIVGVIIVNIVFISYLNLKKKK